MLCALPFFMNLCGIIILISLHHVKDAHQYTADTVKFLALLLLLRDPALHPSAVCSQ